MKTISSCININTIEDALLYELQPDPSVVYVGKTVAGAYNPRYATLKCGWKKVEGENTGGEKEITQTIDSEYSIFFRRRTRSNQTWETTYYNYLGSDGHGTYYKNYLVVDENVTNSGLDVQTYDNVEFLIYKLTSVSISGTLDESKVRDRKVVAVISDGDKAKDSAIASVTPASINIQCYSKGNVAQALSSTSLTFSLKVGNTSVAANKISVSNPSTIPTGVTITGVSYNVKLIAISTSATADGLKNGLTFTVSATIDGITYSAPVTLQLPCSLQGSMSRNYYFAGEAADIQGQRFTVTDYSAPYVKTGEDLELPVCYFYDGDNGTFEFPTSMQMEPNWGTIYSNAGWNRSTNIGSFIITKAIFATFAKFGGAIINMDFLYSQWGFLKGYGNLEQAVEDDTQYRFVDPADMFGNNPDWLDEHVINDGDTGSVVVSSTSFTAISSSVTLESNRWYTVEIRGNNGVSGETLYYKIAKSASGSAPSGGTGSIVSVNGDLVGVTGTLMFQCTSAGEYYLYARKQSGASNFTVDIRMVAPCQFIPHYCVDLFKGKMAANDIIARGKLYANSLYYEHATKATKNGAIIVGDETFVSLRGGGNEFQSGGCGTTITLPATSNSKGRAIEIFTGFTDRDKGYFYLTYSGAENNQSAYFLCPTTSNGDFHYREAWLVANGHQWTESYVKLWCDGTNWWVMKAEITRYVDSDFVIRPAMNI